MATTDANELALTVKRRRLLAEKDKVDRIQREQQQKEQRIADQSRLREERDLASVEKDYKVSSLNLEFARKRKQLFSFLF